MSTELASEFEQQRGAPELTDLGKRLEILRIERGVSKQRLARYAGTSRQQLWRVMTGKSELTSSLRERLASALSIEPTVLTGTLLGAPATRSAVTLPPPAPLTVTEYLSDPVHLANTLRTLPAGEGGRRLKRTLIEAVEELSVESGRGVAVDLAE